PSRNDNHLTEGVRLSPAGLPPLLGLAALALSACGFQPLYAERTGPAADALRQIAVPPIDDPDPAGWLVRRDLERRLDPNAQAADPAYRLDVRLSERRTPLGIQIDASVTRYNYRLTGNFRLVDLADGATLVSGNSESISSYNVVNSQFATLAAEEDAREKAAQQLGADIQLQLALFFSER
ncbi:MAG: LPS assembly lipoprotein LptE, partial [Pseudomonadota bacterium]